MDRLHPWFQCAQQPWCCHRSQRPRGLMCSHKPPASCNNFVEWRMFQWWDRMCKNCRFLLTVFRFHWSTKTQFTILFFLFWKCYVYQICLKVIKRGIITIHTAKNFNHRGFSLDCTFKRVSNTRKCQIIPGQRQTEYETLNFAPVFQT